jgi:hypothetical protein
MFKLTLVEKIFYIVPNLALLAINIDGRLFLLAGILPFVLINGVLIASSTVGYFAAKKGRNRISFFLLSFLVTPILMGLIVAVMADSSSPKQSS